MIFNIRRPPDSKPIKTEGMPPWTQEIAAKTIKMIDNASVVRSGFFFLDFFEFIDHYRDKNSCRFTYRIVLTGVAYLVDK
jgi:hypothetical protein